jgi:predicted GNAT superfamily acetyltransferase
MAACVAIQKRLWAYADHDLIPERMFLVAVEVGGQALGAFDEDQLVGFALALFAVGNGHPYLYSAMTGVLPEYQNSGAGFLLKLAQRDNALSRGIDLIEWAFDPLQIEDAHFDIVRLGVIARRYLPDLCGQTSRPVHADLPSDRLIAEWWIGSECVNERLKGRPVANADYERISVPIHASDICRTDPRRGLQIRRNLRSQFEQFIARGYAAVGFEIMPDKASYLMAFVIVYRVEPLVNTAYDAGL